MQTCRQADMQATTDANKIVVCNPQKKTIPPAAAKKNKEGGVGGMGVISCCFPSSFEYGPTGSGLISASWVASISHHLHPLIAIVFSPSSSLSIAELISPVSTALLSRYTRNSCNCRMGMPAFFPPSACFSCAAYSCETWPPPLELEYSATRYTRVRKVRFIIFSLPSASPYLEVVLVVYHTSNLCPLPPCSLSTASFLHGGRGRRFRRCTF